MSQTSLPGALSRLFPLNGNLVQPLDAPQLLNGIVSGPGNQGTRNTATLHGQAGTQAAKPGLPRSLKFGGSPDAR